MVPICERTIPVTGDVLQVDENVCKALSTVKSVYIGRPQEMVVFLQKLLEYIFWLLADDLKSPLPVAIWNFDGILSLGK